MSGHLTGAEGFRPPVAGWRRGRQVIALLLFLVVGVSLAGPCLCAEGATRGRYTMSLLAIALCRLAWVAYRGTFQYRDYFIYLGVVIGFCIWADQQVHP